MNFLFDIGHPAHVHLFKKTILKLKESQNSVTITIKKNMVIEKLLDDLELDYIILGSKGNNLFEKGIKQLYFTLKTLQLFIKHKIGLAIGVSVSISQASILYKTKSIVFDDDDISVTPVFAALSHTFANNVVSPISVSKDRNRHKDILHHSFHELAYLHPKQFYADDSILNHLQLQKGAFFSIIRFSALKAHHDINEKGISHEQSLDILYELEQKGRVFISSEKQLPTSLEKYRIKIEPNQFHNLLAFASIVVCDSQTVASEAAVLGVPSVRINSFVGRISYLEELQHKYRLSFGFKPEQFQLALEKIRSVISNKDSKKIFQKRRQKMHSEKINLTAFIVWFIENYPKSSQIMKENPDYQFRFK